MKINSLAVFCGSKKGNNPVYTQHAAELGKLLAKNNITLIYGGGSTGIMGAVADAMMDNGGKVIGIITKKLVDWEHQHVGITDLSIVDDMHIRKQKMYDLCDAAVILPGGVGTLDEFFEMVTWNQLSIHDKEIYIINSANFFDFLLKHIQQMEKQGFLYESVLERITVLDEPVQLLQYLN
ncbi:MAG TPA: TIGR00730 family Rossman fold protein [Chitinophagaceae bacterium]|nr:TIGR00730 family Rossman fold protein [Chitinophagaceae bacterium]